MATAKPWNPMEDAYKSKSFNKYVQGPGAELDESLQPGAMASGGNTDKRPDRFQLCLKNVPSDMSEKALWNLCGNYGKVTQVRRTAKTPYVFVAFATLNDMERALERIRSDKPQDIDADIAKHTAASLGNAPSMGNAASAGKPMGNGERARVERDRQSDSGFSSQIDMSKRTIKGPFSNPVRKPLVKRKPFVTEEDYQNSDLKIMDPERNFLIEHDMHESDRNNRQRFEEDTEGGRKMYTGRAYYKDSKETIENMKKAAAASQGNYNPEKDEYIKSAPQFDHFVEKIQNCNLCKKIANKICQRCGDYYCSLECQKKDWNRHRMICFPMPELIAPIDIPNHTFTGTVHSEGPSSNHSMSDSFESKSKGGYQRSDNRNDEHKPYANQQPRSTDNKRSPQQFGDTNKNRSDNRQQNNNRRSDAPLVDSNNQENKKNFMNQNRNQKDRNTDAPYGAKKDFDQKSDSDNRSTISSISAKDSVKKFGNKQSPDKPTSKPESVATDEKVSNVPEKPIQIVRADYPPSGSIVAITAVIRPNKVYIRSLGAEDNLDYVRSINRIHNESKNAKVLDKMPKKSALAIADFQGEGYYRVLVLNPESEDKILVAYIDFGNVDFKKLSELKEISPELIPLKRHALTLTLKGVEDYEPTDKVKEYMNTFVDAVGKDLKLIYDKKNEKGVLEGELIDVSTNENFNEKINDLRNVKVPKLNDEPVFSKDITFKVVPAAENISLVVLDTSLVQTGAISCVLENDLFEIEKMTKIFADYVAKTKGPYTPRPQEICLVQYDDNCWYRAECIEVVGDQNPSVMFIDFGNLTTANISKIRKYPKELLFPCVTLTCLLADMPEVISDALSDRLKELIPANEKILVDKIAVVDEQTNAIYLNEVFDTVKAEGLLD